MFNFTPPPIRSFAWALLLLTVGVACGDDPLTSVPPSTSQVDNRSEERRPESIDEFFLNVTETVPGFGGAFFDEDGNLAAYLTDPERANGLRGALAEIFTVRRVIDSIGSGPSGELNILQGDFDFEILYQIKEVLTREVMAMDGMVFLDIAESENRVVLGAEDPGSMPNLQPLLEDLELPVDAVVVRHIEPDEFSATLRNHLRPTRGGVRIAFNSNVGCTLGPNVSRGGIRSYLINSHCTDVRGVVESTKHYQPATSSGSYLVGEEYLDPNYFTGGACPVGRRCRYSDSALGEYASGVDSYQGRIARTTYQDPDSGSIDIDPYRPFFYVHNEVPFPLENEVLSKIGQRTGWTFGSVISTCYTSNVKDTDITMLCQYKAGGGRSGGDSGSPVFSYSGQMATLYGMQWGGNSDGFAFSSLEKIKWELGSLVTTTSDLPLSVDITGPVEIATSGEYDWDADVSGGDGGYTYEWYHRIDHQTSTCNYQTSWSLVGSASQYSRWVSAWDYDFQLRLEVESGEAKGAKTIKVYPSGDPVCPS